jgi:hypothetical protein
MNRRRFQSDVLLERWRLGNTEALLARERLSHNPRRDRRHGQTCALRSGMGCRKALRILTGEDGNANSKVCLVCRDGRHAGRNSLEFSISGEISTVMRKTSCVHRRAASQTATALSVLPEAVTVSSRAMRTLHIVHRFEDRKKVLATAADECVEGGNVRREIVFTLPLTHLHGPPFRFHRSNLVGIAGLPV